MARLVKKMIFAAAMIGAGSIAVKHVPELVESGIQVYESFSDETKDQSEGDESIQGSSKGNLSNLISDVYNKMTPEQRSGIFKEGIAMMIKQMQGEDIDEEKIKFAEGVEGLFMAFNDTWGSMSTEEQELIFSNLFHTGKGIMSLFGLNLDPEIYDAAVSSEASSIVNEINDEWGKLSREEKDYIIRAIDGNVEYKEPEYKILRGNPRETRILEAGEHEILVRIGLDEVIGNYEEILSGLVQFVPEGYENAGNDYYCLNEDCFLFVCRNKVRVIVEADEDGVFSKTLYLWE